MLMVRDKTGRLYQRPHYSPEELDAECEQLITDFLRSRNGEVTFPVVTDDLTAFLEERVDDLDLYADLSEYGLGVEGVTIFVPGCRPIVKISQDLSGDPRRENRFRTTLTHEFGHVHFHNHLFDPILQAMSFNPNRGDRAVKPSNSQQVCKRDTILEAKETDWMEWQAGHVSGAILMPAGYVRTVVRSGDLVAPGCPVGEGDSKPGRQASELVETVRMAFQVSAEAARIRLLRLKLIAE